MTNANVQVIELAPLGGATNSGLKIGRIAAGAKAAQNDTWTVNCEKVFQAFVQVDASGAAEGNTISNNVITLTSATTGACSAFIIYK